MRPILLIGKSLLHLLPTRPRRIPFGLAKGAVLNTDFRWDSAFYFGQYESELDEHYKKLVRPGDKCFDVGAHRGWSTLILAKLTGGAQIAAFECDPDALCLIEQNVALNHLPVQVVHTFIGTASDGNGNLSLDDAAKQFFVPDFVKMDIEGVEADALAGATELLSTRKPSLMIEVHGEAVEERCVGILREHGYDPQVIDHRRRWGKERRGLAHNRWIAAAGTSRDSAFSVPQFGTSLGN